MFEILQMHSITFICAFSTQNQVRRAKSLTSRLAVNQSFATLLYLVTLAPEPAPTARDGEIGLARYRGAPTLGRGRAAGPVGLPVVGDLQLNELPVLQERGKSCVWQGRFFQLLENWTSLLLISSS